MIWYRIIRYIKFMKVHTYLIFFVADAIRYQDIHFDSEQCFFISFYDYISFRFPKLWSRTKASMTTFSASKKRLAICFDTILWHLNDTPWLSYCVYTKKRDELKKNRINKAEKRGIEKDSNPGAQWERSIASFPRELHWNEFRHRRVYSIVFYRFKCSFQMNFSMVDS